MRVGHKLLASLALVAASGVAGEVVMANCQDNSQYEVRQCARGSWFAAPPAGSGPIAATWWAIGFGNRTLNTISGASAVSPEGSGFLPTPLPGQFIGIDAGELSVQGLDLVAATTIPGLGAPAGATCFSSAANWGAPGVDSCIDANRNSAAGGGAASVSDNYVNRYWGSTYGEGTLTLENQVDPPMATLLTEGSGRYFALAFFASTPKLAPKESDLDAGQFSMADLVNGDTNSFGPVVVPWQTIPQPVHTATLSVPSDPHSPRNISMTWDPLRFIHDGSTRPCFEFDGTTPCASVTGGVGVLDQGALIRYAMESTALDGAGNCGSTWTVVPGSAVDHPATSTVGNGIAEQSCIRLTVSLGKSPATTMGATLATNRLAAQTGQLGDIGYSVSSTARKIGGALVSQKATLKTAVREKGTNLHLTFDTDTELNISSFDVVAIDGKGGRKVVGSVACKQCTSGLSASYDELLSGAKLGGAKQVQIVIQPAGTPSNTLDVKQ